MNAQMYVNILENDLLPYARRIFPVQEYEEIKIIQDNSSIHTARITR